MECFYFCLRILILRSYQLVIEVEVNFDNSIIGDTFLKVNNLIKKNNYKLNTIYPSYQVIEKRSFIVGDYHNPISRNPLNQSDCYYILKKKEYSLRDIAMFIGYGFIIEAKQELQKIEKKIRQKEKDIFKKLIKLLE